MKVLFAVHDEKVSLSIVKKFQKEYKEIISYKNVYYFNAILKELQRDKTYDRIIIDEELEEFTSTNYAQKDKFIFDRLDSITDEASNSVGSDIPIILICSERRNKSEEFLVKLFGIGIYNAIIGNDRSTDEVCRLIKKPRSKKEAKSYYKIDVDDVNYHPEDEYDVSEEEMQYILSYFNKLGRNEEKYAEVFKNIVSQYNEKQLRIIISTLPLHVRSVLEESSPEYQRLVATRGKYVPNKVNLSKSNTSNGPSEKLLSGSKVNLGKPIVVPSKLDKTLIKKITLRKPTIEAPKIESYEEDEDEDIAVDVDTNVDVDIDANLNAENLNSINDLEVQETPTLDIQEEPAKRGRGRPRKTPVIDQVEENKVPKKRGRPRKNPVEEDNINDLSSDENNRTLPGFENIEEDNETLPGFEEVEDNDETLPGFEEVEDNDETLPGFKEVEDNDETLPGFEEVEDNDETLPGFEEVEEDNENVSNFEEVEEDKESLPGFEEVEEEFELINRNPSRGSNIDTTLPGKRIEDDFDYTEYDSLLSSDRKVITFVGTSKNGTSFIVNNVAKVLSDNGINTAILDATKNQNAYYTYTDNQEELRLQAIHGIRRLAKGMSEGVKVNNNLTVYTELPGGESYLNSVGSILETLIKNHSVVLIDCDFDTPIQYFNKAQENYLIQSMDVLTIQPLTAFLRDLKSAQVLDQNKLRIILNKIVKVRGVNWRKIVGGMSKYNAPEMNLMTDLFDVESVVPIAIGFDMDVYEKYLAQLIDCKITTDSYSKEFQTVLKNLASVVYPLLPGKGQKNKRGYNYDVNTENYSNNNNGFSNSVNNTLNNMKKRY